jgi:hypothetical protein
MKGVEMDKTATSDRPRYAMLIREAAAEARGGAAERARIADMLEAEAGRMDKAAGIYDHQKRTKAEGLREFAGRLRQEK